MSCPECQQSGERSGRKARWLALLAAVVVGAIGAAELAGGDRGAPAVGEHAQGATPKP